MSSAAARRVSQRMRRHSRATPPHPVCVFSIPSSGVISSCRAPLPSHHLASPLLGILPWTGSLVPTRTRAVTWPVSAWLLYLHPQYCRHRLARRPRLRSETSQHRLLPPAPDAPLISPLARDALCLVVIVPPASWHPLGHHTLPCLLPGAHAQPCS